MDSQFSRTSEVLGTPAEITVWAADATAAARALDQGFGELQRVEQVFSMVRQGSSINEINQFASRRPVEVSAEMISVLQWAGKISEATQGAFDITTAAYAWEYGFGQGEFHVPTRERLEDVKLRVGYKNVVLYPQDKTVVFKHDGVQIDLGEIARSYALNSVKSVLKKINVAAARIRLGSGITWVNANPQGGLWSVGIQHPRDAHKLLATAEISGGKVLCSGDYERFFTHEGVRYTTILEPATGSPAPYSMAATLWLPDNPKLDLPSEALLLQPPAKALALVQSIPGAEALIVDAQKNIWLTPGWKEKLKIQW
jgi:thiamine biosynthesis lipoprotein